MHFDFVGAACEDRRAASWTEKPAGIVARLAFDGDSLRGKNRGSKEQGAMMLAAIETVANPDPVWCTRREDPDVAAQATACELVHDGVSFSTEQRQRRKRPSLR